MFHHQSKTYIFLCLNGKTSVITFIFVMDGRGGWGNLKLPEAKFSNFARGNVGDNYTISNTYYYLLPKNPA